MTIGYPPTLSSLLFLILQMSYFYINPCKIRTDFRPIIFSSVSRRPLSPPPPFAIPKSRGKLNILDNKGSHAYRHTYAVRSYCSSYRTIGPCTFTPSLSCLVLANANFGPTIRLPSMSLSLDIPFCAHSSPCSVVSFKLSVPFLPLCSTPLTKFQSLPRSLAFTNFVTLNFSTVKSFFVLRHSCEISLCPLILLPVFI